MIEVGQLRRWVRLLPALPRESTPGTLFLILEAHVPKKGEVRGGWTALHGGMSKWYYDNEIENFSEVVSD